MKLRLAGHVLRLATGLLIVVPVVVACGGPAEAVDESSQAAAARVYALTDLAGIGWKQKGEFATTFEGAQESAWGFLDGREVAVIVYPDLAQARSVGAGVGKSQTEVTVDGVYAPGVERTKCAGFGNYRTPYRVEPASARAGCGIALSTDGLGSSEKCAIAIAASLERSRRTSGVTAQPVCPKRIPTYVEFVIEGNLVILCEPRSNTEVDCAGVAKRLRGS
ncbi:MAG: hypothetical protein HY682_01650 [Chloroflexi bacterium]|nr:hypothetical protein [Chloroflexota bacterium]